MNKKYLLAVVASTLMFAACGDDVTEVNEIHQDGMAVLEAGEKLSKQACDTTNVGEMLFVMDSSAAFVCNGKSWQTFKGEDGGKGDPGKDGDNGTGCTSKSVKNAAGLEGLEVTCGETAVDTVWNGKDGENGKPGDPGKPGDAGTSCTAKSVKNKSGIEGVEVTCGETVVDTIWNGKNGKDGEDGDNGTSCTAKSVKNKSGLEGLEVTCGETVIDTIWNGKNGQNGNNGTSCIAEPVKNAAGLKGLEVTCDNAVIDTIWNGKDGQNGNDGTSCTATVNLDGGFDLVCDGQTVGTITNGEDGVGCTLDDEGDGKVTVSCGKGSAMTTTILYKAVCGTKPYDPAKSFCSEGEVYELCGEKTYEPKKQFCDTRDNQIYGYVTIAVGDYAETWMAENLNYSVNPDEQSWCYDNDASNCDKYGRLYTWAAAVGKSEDECGDEKTCNLPSGDIRGVCPEGWHLPSKDEWETLITAVGGSSKAGTALKSQTGWYSQTGDAADRDAYGFSALPAGYRNDSGGFYDEGNLANFWSSTEYDSNLAYRWSFYDNNVYVSYGWNVKYDGFSVRCLRDSN